MSSMNTFGGYLDNARSAQGDSWMRGDMTGRVMDNTMNRIRETRTGGRFEGQPSGADPFPNMARTREQLEGLWRHIATVLSDGIRNRALAGEGQQQGLTPVRPDKAAAQQQGAWEREMGSSLTPLPPEGMDEEVSVDMANLPQQKRDPGAQGEDRLSGEDVGRLLMQRGVTGQGLITMIAIAMAESSNNPRAHNPDATTGDNSYGLFQINMLDKPGYMMGQERRQRWGIENEDLWDPETNVDIAVQMSRGGTKFEDWSVFNSGKYLEFWGVASKAAQAVERAMGNDMAARGAR
jgi:hypothetical protein